MAKIYRATAIILKRQNLGEADRLITVFSERSGKLKLMAKGIRKLTSRKKGHLEIFTLSRLMIVTTKSIDLITEAATVNNFSRLRQNLNRVRIAYLFCELVDKLTVENQEQVAIFALLKTYLSQLNSQSVTSDLIVNFETELLKLLGFGLPAEISRESLETHIASITERTLHSNKIR
ncbi:MAG: DNA repair protein RecO [Patescibacteria group bacterium]|mgnify:CR=1 FL=1